MKSAIGDYFAPFRPRSGLRKSRGPAQSARMPRSLLARSLEPLVAISWGIFLAWSLWLTAVWVLGINQQWLGLPISSAEGWDAGVSTMVQDVPMPHYADFRKAVLVLANHAELAWFALALIQLHLHVISVNGVNTGRTWLGIAVGGSFLLVATTRAFGFPFGWMYFSKVLGAQFFNVPLGWLLLWAVLLIGSREAMLRLMPRAGHAKLSAAAAVVILVTMANLHYVAINARAWWFWHKGDIREVTGTPGWFWISWLAAAWFLSFLLREKHVADASAARSPKPLIVIALLNVAALLAHLRSL